VAVVEGRFASRILSIELDRSSGPEETGDDERRAHRFLGEVRRRWIDRVELANLLGKAERGEDLGSLRDRVELLRARSPEVEVAEMDALASELEGSPIIDDAWLSFALSPVWDGDVATRVALLTELARRFPGSTGARQAQAYLARPEDYLSASEPW
jgi:hypothetical protein